MTRDLFEQIGPALKEMDKYLLKLQEKYGEFYHLGKEYILFDTPEEDSYTNEVRYTEYLGFDAESIEIEEMYDEADSMDEIDIRIHAYRIRQDEFGNVEMSSDGFYYWEDNSIVYHLAGIRRRVV